jgi:predicted DNA-binding transcriptional regulator YafY
MVNRLDRALGILLLLRQGKTVSAAELAERFEVSQRTIYRDIALLGELGELGVPVYAEMGCEGGFRLMEGYVLPPIMFTEGESISLLIGLALLGILRVKPYETELESARHKLLAALPEHLRHTLAHVQRIIGLERLPVDIFNPDDLDLADRSDRDMESVRRESRTLTTFLRAILGRDHVTIRYRSPRRAQAKEYLMQPLGLIWDRERWYLVGKDADSGKQRTLRSDRVIAMTIRSPGAKEAVADFEVSGLLGRKWLREAMRTWSGEAPVRIRLSRTQAERIRRDWYFGHADYREVALDLVEMTFGELDREFVFELLRWLGPGAELVEPGEWRAAFQAQLQTMIEAHAPGCSATDT